MIIFSHHFTNGKFKVGLKCSIVLLLLLLLIIKRFESKTRDFVAVTLYLYGGGLYPKHNKQKRFHDISDGFLTTTDHYIIFN